MEYVLPLSPGIGGSGRLIGAGRLIFETLDFELKRLGIDLGLTFALGIGNASVRSS